MARKAKKYNRKTRITSALRKIWFYSPERRQAVKQAKDSGNKCQICKKVHEKLEIDHDKPVVPISGFDNWDNYIERLFEGKLIAICSNCHKAKTAVQREQRKKYKELK